MARSLIAGAIATAEYGSGRAAVNVEVGTAIVRLLLKAGWAAECD